MNLPLPDASSPDYTAILVYQARAHIALNDPKAALRIIPQDTNFVLRAVSSLARYVGAEDASGKEAALEELRDLCVEIEGEEDVQENEKGSVRVLAGTAFVHAGEVEEALETLGAGNDTENLEAYVSNFSLPLTPMTSYDSLAVADRVPQGCTYGPHIPFYQSRGLGKERV